MKKTILVMISIVLIMSSCTSPVTTDETMYQEAVPLAREIISNEPLVPEEQQEIEQEEIQKEEIEQESEEPSKVHEDEELPTVNTLNVDTSVSQVQEIDDSIKVKEEPAISNVVSISITAVEEIILESSLVELQANQTVFDILNQTTRENKIHMDYSGRGGTIYIKGINNIYEHDMGAESGWMYSVNGEFPNTSCGSYVLEPGDVIEWRYTLNLGRDLGSSFD